MSFPLPPPLEHFQRLGPISPSYLPNEKGLVTPCTVLHRRGNMQREIKACLRKIIQSFISPFIIIYRGIKQWEFGPCYLLLCGHVNARNFRHADLALKIQGDQLGWLELR